MSVARHPRPPELVDVPIEDIMQKFVGRFREKKPDWAAFEDAKIEGYKRAQHRFIGAGGSGKHTDPTVIPAKNFTLSIMYVEPGQGNAAHTHEVEECFFVLQGYLDVFVEDESGKRLDLQEKQEPPRGTGAPFLDQFRITRILAAAMGASCDMAAEPYGPGGDDDEQA